MEFKKILLWISELGLATKWIIVIFIYSLSYLVYRIQDDIRFFTAGVIIAAVIKLIFLISYIYRCYHMKYQEKPSETTEYITEDQDNQIEVEIELVEEPEQTPNPDK